MNRNISTISLFSVILILLLGGWFVLYMYNKGVNIAVNDNENRGVVNNDDRNSLVQEENKEIVSGNPIDSHVDAVDISDWKIYQDEAVSFKYPPQYEINAQGIQDGLVVFGTKDRLRTTFLSEGKEEISETGFVLSVNIVKLSESYI